MSKWFWAPVVVAIAFATATPASAAMPSGLGGAGDAMNVVQSGVVSVDWREHRRHRHHQFFFGQSNDFRPNYYRPYYNRQYYGSNGYYIYPRHFDRQPGFTFQFGF
jgi:hypothetical protein